MAAKVVAIIPARYNSQRFNGKVLYPIAGMPLLYHIWKSIASAKSLSKLLITTDDQRIKAAAESFGAEVIMSSGRHRTGSDRVAEISEKVSGDIFINVQADNFGIKPAFINNLVANFAKDKTEKYGTVVKKIRNDNFLFNPNCVKTVLDKTDHALWFSRFPIPYLNNLKGKTRNSQHNFWEHIGIYLFRKAGLKKYAGWKRTEAEKAESLEQLRILENGERIKVYKTTANIISIDNKDDLRRIKI